MKDDRGTEGLFLLRSRGASGLKGPETLMPININQLLKKYSGT
jgi:hypothetical protein